MPAYIIIMGSRTRIVKEPLPRNAHSDPTLPSQEVESASRSCKLKIFFSDGRLHIGDDDAFCFNTFTAQGDFIMCFRSPASPAPGPDHQQLLPWTFAVNDFQNNFRRPFAVGAAISSVIVTTDSDTARQRVFARSYYLSIDKELDSPRDFFHFPIDLES